jgi:hypothetical protein
MAGKIAETKPSPTFPDSSFKYTPLRHVRVLFIRFCQGLFFGAPPGSYHWDPDEERSEITITNENKLDPETINKRPGIHFTRGPCMFYSLGIDDRTALDMTTDQKEKGVLVPGTMTINLVSRVDQESEDLAWVVAEHIWLLRDRLMRAGFFEIGRQPQIGSPSQAGSIVSGDAGDEFCVTPVSVPWQFARNSKLTPLGKRIVQSIEQNLTTSLRPVQTLGAAWHGHEYPVNVTNCPPPSFAPEASDAQGSSPDPGRSRQYFLPKQPHPLNPAVMVSVRTVSPFRPGLRSPNAAPLVPITDPCVEES